MSTKPTGYWTFFCNPKKWEIDRFLSLGLSRDNYMITEWQAAHFAPGQLGVIRVGIDRRTKQQLAGRARLLPGVYAVVEVESLPFVRTADNDGLWLEREPEAGTRLAVAIRYVKSLASAPLLLEHLANDPDADDKYLLDGFQAASMPLVASVFHRIVELAGTPDEAFDAIDRGPADSTSDLDRLEREFANAVPEVRASIGRRIERGPLASAVKARSGYRCLVCAALNIETDTFVKRNGKPYIEVHHVSPVSTGTAGVLGLRNLMTVCAEHHRQLHYGFVDPVELRETHFFVTLDGKRLQIPRFTLASLNTETPRIG